jgi:cystathionine beta-synthase
MTRRLAREEAILCGGSAGTALYAGLTYAKKMDKDQLMLVMLPDTGERYLSKVHSDEWMRDNHLLDLTQTRVADVLEGKVSTGEMPAVLSLGEEEPVRNAVQLVKSHEISQIPVFREKEVVGTVYDAELLKLVLEDASVLDKPIKDVMEKPLPEVRRDDPVSQAARLLAQRNSAVLVRENGNVVGILTRYDVIEYISE